MDGAAAFDAADGEAHGVGEAAHDSRLVFQRGLEGLVEFSGFVKVDNVDVAVGGGDDEELVLDVHGVDALLVLDVGDGSGAAEVPVFHCLVPGAGHEHGVARGFDEAARPNGCVVRCDLLRWCRIGG